MTELLTSPNGVATPTPPVMAAQPPPAAKDFSRKRKRLVFTIDDDTFEAASTLPGDIYAEMVVKYDGIDNVDAYQGQHDLIKDALQLALLPESFERFSARMKDRANPIDDGQMADVVMWLLEEYGLRPTQPSQPSSDGPASPESGTSSTESTPPAESTSAASQPTDS